LAALALNPLPFPPMVDQVLARIGDTLAPLALLTVGLQLRFDALREYLRPLCLGLAYKLMACPAVVVAVVALTGIHIDSTSQVAVIEAAMPPMIGAAVVATQLNLAPRLVSSMVALGIPIGLMTAPLWHLAFNRLST
jgi:predicted permease